MVLMLFYLWDHISALTGVYASTWPVAAPQLVKLTLDKSVPTPAELESQLEAWTTTSELESDS